MNSTNAPALFRSLIVYAICVPLAIAVGYMLTGVYGNLDYGTLGFFAAIVGLLILPILIRWHYPLLLVSASLPAYMFFIKGSPTLFMLMTVVSLGLSVMDRILSKRHFITATAMTWPLIALLAVVFITAELTGGFGLRVAGSEVYGGKKYITLICGILSYFALTSRAIPAEKVRLYVSLFFIGGILSFIGDLYVVTPSAFQFIYLVFPPNLFQYGIEFGSTRLPGFGFAGLAGLIFMMARYGLRDCLLTGKLWRVALMVVFVGMMLLGGARSSLILFALLFCFQFFIEGLQRTSLLPIFAGLGVVGIILLIPLANKLPITYQRSLAFLPLDLNPVAVADAKGSSDWRITMWQDLLPQIPQYLLLGKGYAIKPEDFNEMMGRDVAFQEVDESQIGLALAGDYHNGPLSVILPFGIWGCAAFLCFIGGTFYVLRSNYRYGAPEFRQINGFLLAYFLARCVLFFFVFGAMQNDVGLLAQLAGLSVAINRGVHRSEAARLVMEAQAEAVDPNVPRLSPAGHA